MKSSYAVALIDCPECRNSVSDSAVACPHCGRPITGDAQPPLPLPPRLAVPPVPMDRIASAQYAAALGLGIFLLAIAAVLFWAAHE